MPSPGKATMIPSGESEEEDPNNLMVSGPMRPFVIPVTVQNLRTFLGVKQGALIDSGCTRCLICRAVIEELGVCMVKLKKPIKFKQMDSSTLGGAPATHITEPVRLEIGEHQEDIRFIVVDKMIEPIILGLAWLDKWEPTSWWEGGGSVNSESPWALAHLTNQHVLRGRWYNRLQVL